MAVLKALHGSGMRFPGTLMLQAVMGEEMAEAGTRTLLKLGYTGDCAIVLEPTELKICRATRGVAWFRITLTGDSTHCGRAGPESIDVMAQFTRFGAALAEYHDRISAQFHPLLPSPAARITRVRGGNRHNHLATECEFIVDRRMLPGETFDGVRDDLVAILETLKASDPALGYRIDLDRGNEPSVIPEDSAIINVLRRNSREARGIDAEVVGKVAGTDMRNFVLDAGIPAVNFGPGSFETGNCHAPNEFVPVDELVDCARVVMGTAIDVLSRTSI
jgi:succinyl-diaminopimelate desuccinylase